ncbi:phage major capsid protein [Pyruvatibacter mobilis]|uniref:phage major capsid protein n=1 Tax=Pyruvatibacter mobilis TaxID=1712261 RepID=UPI003BB11902
MDAEVKTALEELQATHKGLNDKLVEGHEEMKKLGTELPETKAAIEKANEAVSNVVEKVKKLEDDAKEAKSAQERLETLLNRSGKGMGETEAVERKSAADFLTAAKRRYVHPSDESVDIEAYGAYKAAWRALAFKGFDENAPGIDLKALAVGRDPDGGYLVPTEIGNEVIKRIYDTSPMRQISQVISITSDAWEQPVQSSKGTSGGWVGELQSRSTTATPALKKLRIPVHEQYAFPQASQQMLEDSIVDIESWLTQETDEEMARIENTAFVSGSGADEPRGFLDYKSAAVTADDATRDWGVLQYVPSGASGAFPTASGYSDYDALVDMIAKLNPGYRAGAVWFMNRSTEAALRKMKDADGNSLLGLNLRDGATGFQCLGFPIVTGEDMPDISVNSYSIAFGNFQRGYKLVDRLGTSVLRDPYSNKPYVGFYMRRRVGGDVQNFDAIKLMKFANS